MELTDDQMRQAWSRFTTDQIRQMPMPKCKDEAERKKVAAGRARILRIREWDERNHKGQTK